MNTVKHTDTTDSKDALFRISVKGLIINDEGEVLLVKESGRSNWDLPGGGMDYGESVQQALARELYEEVNLTGEFSYDIIAYEEPKLLKRTPVYQLCLIFRVIPTNMSFSPGDDADEVLFVQPESLKDSDEFAERRTYEYARLIGA